MKDPNIPHVEDYDDLLLYEFHEAGILIEDEKRAQWFVREWNEKSLIAWFGGLRMQLFPPFGKEQFDALKQTVEECFCHPGKKVDSFCDGG